MRVTQVGYTYDAALSDPDQLLDTYTTLTGWSEALLEAGAASVCAVQRFHRSARVVRRGVVYEFCPRGSLNRAVCRSTPSVAHVNGLGFPLQTWLLRRMLPSDAVIVVQDHASGPVITDSRRGMPLRRLVRRHLLRAADGFLFTAVEQAASWHAAGLIGPGHPLCEALEGSTRLQPIDLAEARSVTGMTGHPSVLWVGRLNANKDPLTVLDGFERSLPELPAAELTMVFGADDLLPVVRTRLQQSPRLTRHVRLVGAVPHGRLAAYYSAADLFVLGSQQEGSGYALLEACACGAVPLVTDIPSFRRITAGGRVGALWPRGDAAALGRLLVQFGAGNLPEYRRETMSHFARELSWSAVGGQALAAYRQVQRCRRARVAA